MKRSQFVRRRRLKVSYFIDISEVELQPGFFEILEGASSEDIERVVTSPEVSGAIIRQVMEHDVSLSRYSEQYTLKAVRDWAAKKGK